MEDDAGLVQAAGAGDHTAFTTLVERYRNTVYGLAYGQIGDFDRARDVAQEVFVRAFQRLHTLRTPEKFAPWLYQMTVNECRMRHRSEGRIALGISDAVLDQQWIEAPDTAIQNRVLIQQALECLTPDSRRAILLFYFHGCSLQEIAAFLNSSVSAVKSRLRDARARLRREMLEMIEETVKAAPLPEDFSQEIVTRLLQAAYDGETETVRVMLDKDARLATARGNISGYASDATPLLMAAVCNRVETIELLRGYDAFTNLSRQDFKAMLHAAAFHQNRSLVDEIRRFGIGMDIFTCCLLGEADRVQEIVRRDPQSIQALDGSGSTPLHSASTPEIAAVLLDAGADIEAVGEYGNTPAEYLNFRRPVVDYLISRGAKVSFCLACSRNDVARVTQYIETDASLITAKQGARRPEGNTSPINIAVIYQAIGVVRLLLDHGVEVNTRDEGRGGATPLHFAARGGNVELVRLLLERQADYTVRAYYAGGTYGMLTPDAPALTWAQKGKQEGWGTPDLGHHDAIIALLEAATSAQHFVEQAVTQATQ